MRPSSSAKLRWGVYRDYLADFVEEDGRIRMTYEDGAWITLVNNPEKLNGLRFGFLAAPPLGGESPSPSKRDPWSDRITPESGKSFRGSIIADAPYEWKWDAAPREWDKNKWMIYQVHVGSVFG